MGRDGDVAHGNLRWAIDVISPMNRRPAIPVLAATLVLIVAACTSAGVGPTATAPVTGSPPAPPPATPPPVPITTPEQAARLVLLSDPRFGGIGPYDPGGIGQAAWYEARAEGDRFRVVVRIGWGDCPAGCIDEHRWTYEVTRDGTVRLVEETGPSLPPGIVPTAEPSVASSPPPSPLPSVAPGWSGVVGRVTAGPVCPVERVPPDPACAPRPVAGAVLVVSDPSGREVARATSDANGGFSIALPSGRYVLAPQPVEGLLGTVPPVEVTITAGGPPASLEIQYDTGIR